MVGQACTASKRFIVDDDVYDEFVEKLISGMANWQPADPTSAETKLGPLASNSGAEELDEIVQEAISRGAEVLLGGSRPTGAYYPPTVLARVTRGMRAYREELFGPVAVFYPSVARRGYRAGRRLAVRPCLVFTTDPGDGQPGGRGARDRHGVDQQHQQDLAGPSIRWGQGLPGSAASWPGSDSTNSPTRLRSPKGQRNVTADTQDTRDRTLRWWTTGTNAVSTA